MTRDEYHHQWYLKNADYVKAKAREWRLKNITPEQERTRSAKWRAENPLVARATTKRWRQKNKDKVAAKERRRRARKYGNGGSHTAADVIDILRMQLGRCAVCRIKLGKKYEVDHITPLVRGGSNDRRNLQILCQGCNRKKKDRDPIDFMRAQGALL